MKYDQLVDEQFEVTTRKRKKKRTTTRKVRPGLNLKTIMGVVGDNYEVPKDSGKVKDGEGHEFYMRDPLSTVAAYLKKEGINTRPKILYDNSGGSRLERSCLEVPYEGRVARFPRK